MRLFLLVVSLLPAVRAADVMDIVHAYSAHQASGYDRARDYTYEQHFVMRKLNRDGTLKSTFSETYEVLPANGTVVHKLTERDGKAVTAEESLKKQREEKRFQARLRRRSPRPRTLQDDFDRFELEGEEVLNGRPAWVVAARKTSLAGMVQVRARFWIDEVDLDCAKFQRDGALNMITIDGRMHRASSGTFVYVRMAEGVWLPSRTVFRSDAHEPFMAFPAGLLAQQQDHWEIETTYLNYKKFQADSHVIQAAEPN